MGIRFWCPNGHKLNVKSFQAGSRGICPFCGAKFQIPYHSVRPSSKEEKSAQQIAEAQGGQAVPQPPDSIPSGDVAVPTEAELSRAAAAQPAPATPAPAETDGGDPLAEAPDAVWYVRPPSGGQYGPATSDIMAAWIEEGRVDSDSLIWREGWPDWAEAREVLPQLGAGRVPGPTDIVAEPTSVAAAAATRRRPRGRRRSNATTAVVLTTLILLVIVLFVVLVWILSNGSGSSNATAMTTRPFVQENGASRTHPTDLHRKTRSTPKETA